MDESGFPPPIVIVPKEEVDSVDINENELHPEMSTASVKMEIETDNASATNTLYYDMLLYPCPLCVKRFKSKTEMISHHQVRMHKTNRHEC